MSLSPYFKSPFTDLTGNVVSHQWYGRCADMEMKALDCLEAYGMERGMKKCQLLMQDFKECAFRHKQLLRYKAMTDERQRQYAAGERSKEERYATGPKPDSY